MSMNRPSATSTRSGGFTIIELMIVVAIISILAVIALPVYQDYVIRSKVSEGLIFLAEAKTTVSERYYSTFDMPTNNTIAGLRDPNDYDEIEFVKSLVVTSQPRDGTIVVTFDLPGTLADQKQLRLVPDTRLGDIHWTCEPTEAPLGLKLTQAPPNCRG